jgi:predicted NBD/HSP70 family sugar kinase
MTPCVVADLGGTFLRCALVYGGNSVAALERIRLPGDAYSRSDGIWTDIVDSIAAYVGRHASELSAASSIAFAFPGPILGGNVPASAPTVLGGRSAMPDIRALLARRTGRAVVLLNDVSAAAWYFRGRTIANRFVVVTISSGIGAKIYDRHHPLGVLDDVPRAGEIGHLVVDYGSASVVCDCGGRGHLGAYSSARGFERSARIAARDDRAGFARSLNVTRFGATAATLSNEAHLVPALRAGDAWSMDLLRAAIRPLADVLRTLCVGCGLDGIMLMGGFAQALGESYRALVEDAVGMLSDCGPARTDLGHRIILAGPGEEPSLVGAAAYAQMSRLVS